MARSIKQIKAAMTEEFMQDAVIIDRYARNTVRLDISGSPYEALAI